MKYRKLRITWSVAWGIACLLLVALWVRSCWRIEQIEKHVLPYWFTRTFTSYRGQLTFVIHDETSSEAASQFRWIFTSRPITEKMIAEDRGILLPPAMLRFQCYYDGALVFDVPHWFIACLVAAVGVLPWHRWRFSLRTLLIVMTVAAMGLGWMVYALRN